MPRKMQLSYISGTVKTTSGTFEAYGLNFPSPKIVGKIYAIELDATRLASGGVNIYLSGATGLTGILSGTASGLYYPRVGLPSGALGLETAGFRSGADSRTLQHVNQFDIFMRQGGIPTGHTSAPSGTVQVWVYYDEY